MAECLVEKGAVNRLKDIFNNLAQKDLNKAGYKNALRVVGKLVGGLAKSSDGFDQILKETDLVPKLIEAINQININQDLINRKDDQETLKEGFLCIKNLCENDFDKAKIIENKVAECLLNAIKRFNQIPNSTYRENENLQILL